MSSRFSYQAVDVSGKPVNGFHDAENIEEVGSWLVDRGYFVVEIKQAPIQTIVNSKRRIRVSADDLNFFYIQLASLINAGCPLLLSIDALARQTQVRGLALMLEDIGDKIRSGKSFSEALKAHDNVFPNLFITMIEVGEVGGILDQVLERYAFINDSGHRLKKKMIKAMIYPSVLLLLTITIAWAVLVFVFPSLIGGFQKSGQTLPLPTQIVLTASNILTGYYLHIFLLIIIVFFVYWQIKRTKAGGEFIDKLWLKIIGIGNVIRQLHIVLFSRTLGVLLSSGVPILTSIQTVKRTMTNTCYKNAMQEVEEAVSRGEAVSQAMGKHRALFSDTMILMVSVGEQTGKIGEMLEKMGKIYEGELESAIEHAISLLEPCLVVFISIFVVILALAVYLPIFDMNKQIR